MLLLTSGRGSAGSSGYAPGSPTGYHQSSPPPRMTSGLVTSMNCRAISLCAPRSGTWEPNAAGVASVTWAVVTSPVALRRSLACSRSVFTELPFTSTETAPLYERTPVANAVAAAAESVTASSGSSESV